MTSQFKEIQVHKISGNKMDHVNTILIISVNVFHFIANSMYTHSMQTTVL